MNVTANMHQVTPMKTEEKMIECRSGFTPQSGDDRGVKPLLHSSRHTDKI